MEKKTCVQSTNVVCTSLERIWVNVCGELDQSYRRACKHITMKEAGSYTLTLKDTTIAMNVIRTYRKNCVCVCVCPRVRACICVRIRIVQMTENCAYKGQTM